ncbi:hypothetical protein IMSAGC019_03678 [Lachnospiraceae bacterium]|nr:hypothetical protein IMSAGC019_03678 [Lachnospiraceae bacterium]
MGFLFIVFVHNIPYDFFQDILHGHKPGSLPIFIHDDYHLGFRMLHGLEQCVYIFRLRNKPCFPQKPWDLPHWQFHIPFRPVGAHGIPEVENPDNVVDVLLKNRETAFAFTEHVVNGFFQSSISVNPQDIDPVGHNIMGFLVAEFKDFRYHLSFRRHQHPLLMPFVYHGDDLLLRHILRIPVRMDTKNPQYPFGCKGNQPCYWAEYLCNIVNRVNAGICPFGSILCPQPLRDQHPEGKQYVEQHCACKENCGYGK